MKFEIKNRKDERLACNLEENSGAVGLVFVCHGLGGFKNQKHIRTMCKAFFDRGFNVVSFDTTNTFGESDGNYENATATNYLEDLEDVIEHAKTQDWFISPFYLCGHSLGGITTITYSEENPDDIKGLIPVSSVITADLLADSNPERVAKWRETGWRIETSGSTGKVKKLNWTQYEPDLEKYDALEGSDNLTMPVLLIVGEDDDRTLPKHQRLFLDKLNCDKQLEIIDKAPHTFVQQEHLDKIYDIITNWLDRVD